MEKNQGKIRAFLNFDVVLCFVLAGILAAQWLKIITEENKSIYIVIAVAFIATAAVVFNAIRSLINKKISIDLLASVALAVSLIEREWASVIFINLMIASARVFSHYVAFRSHSAIRSLLKLKPKNTKIEKDGRVIEVPIETVRKGDKVVVQLGERIPIDGVVENGEATIDQSSLTGESAPVFKKNGDQVLSSTIVVSGNLIVRVEKVGGETTLEKIIDLVEKSQVNKANIETLGDKFAKWYIVATFAGSLLIYFFSHNIGLVLAVLLVSCADDVAVATPLALLAAITHSVKHGAIVKGGNFMEGLSKVKIIFVDKTGTLTHGKMKIEKIIPFADKKPEEVLALATIASLMSNHPVSQAIVNYAKEKKLAVAASDEFKEYKGKGTEAIFQNKKIMTGKLSFFLELNVNINPRQIFSVEEEELRGFNVTLIVYDNELVGLIVLADKLRPQLKETMAAFRKSGVEKIVMLTGDNENNAKRVAEAAGIEDFHANLSPEGKLEVLKKHLSAKYKTAMIGDGVNDAPVLPLSDIGIAMGAIGSDAAIESSDIALMKDDLSQVPELIKISQQTLKVIRQNLIMWGIVNFAGLLLVFLGVMGPTGAAAYNFGTDFLPILNSIRLFR